MIEPKMANFVPDNARTNNKINRKLVPGANA